MKFMHPTTFLGCNSRTLPCLILAGAPGPTGLQSARSRAGPAGQISVFCPLDFQRTLGCLGKPRGSELCAKGWSGKGLDPKGEVFLRRPRWGALRIEYVVPCSTQSQFPYLWSAPHCCTNWMPIQGNQEHTKWNTLSGFPAAMATPRAQLGIPPPTAATTHLPVPRRLVSSAPSALLVRSQPQWRQPRAQLGPPPAPRHDTTPAPCRPGFAPPRVRSGCCPHLHHGLPVSPAPTPGSRRGSQTYFTYCHQMKPEDK